MNALSFSFVDLLVVGVLVISAGFAAYRGFVQESLSILAWAAAAFAALYFGPSIVPLLKGALSGWAAMIVAYAGPFLVVVIPLSFVSFRFAENVRQSPVHALDRTLGLVFGVIRGLVIVAVVYLIFSILVPIPRQPTWMTQARLLPLIQESSEVLLAMIPEQKTRQASRGDAHERLRPRARPERPSSAHDAETAQTRKTPKKTYGAKERRALDKLIETTADGDGTER
jgi:membrane protein required for colicin V production